MTYSADSDHSSDARQYDARQYAAATERNRESILAVLRQVLPAEGTVLEIASGTGQHAAYFAPQLVPRYWLPSDPQALLRASIRAWRDWAGASNVLPPLAIDAASPEWDLGLGGDGPGDNVQPDKMRPDNLQPDKIPAVTAVVNINMIHISPWAAGLGLLAGAGRLLTGGGVLYLYGPYRRGGEHTAPSNAEFDRWLRSQNPDWGVRNLETVVEAAAQQGLTLSQVIDMPANNLSVIFEKQP